MSFIDEIYELYKNKLTGDEEDAIALVLNLLEDHGKRDLHKLIEKMKEEELYQMVAMYLIEMLKAKMANEGLEDSSIKTANNDFHIH